MPVCQHEGREYDVVYNRGRLRFKLAYRCASSLEQEGGNTSGDTRRPTASHGAEVDGADANRCPSNKERRIMQHQGGCHCGNLQVHVRLTKPPAANHLRSCACSFCRSHATRTVSDPQGQVDLRASDWSLVGRYRFGSRTADYLLCHRCGVYIGAICETSAGTRAVVNTLCLHDRAAFTRSPVRHDYDGEATGARLARRAANWMPAVVHGDGAAR